jgi:cyclophilin family peptidyl-prolyl cis-trans isomerase
VLEPLRGHPKTPDLKVGLGEWWSTMSKAAVAIALFLVAAPSLPAQKSAGAGPVIVLETVKGTIEFETYPDEAPKTVGRIIELAKKNFYNGLRFHRAEPKFLIQIGDPTTRDMSRRSWWGRAGSGKPIGVAEITKKRRHTRGAVAMAHSGSAREGDSQFYILRRAAPELDGKYTVFGRVIAGMEVVDKIEEADILKKASVKP